MKKVNFADKVRIALMAFTAAAFLFGVVESFVSVKKDTRTNSLKFSLMNRSINALQIQQHRLELKVSKLEVLSQYKS